MDYSEDLFNESRDMDVRILITVHLFLRLLPEIFFAVHTKFEGDHWKIRSIRGPFTFLQKELAPYTSPEVIQKQGVTWIHVPRNNVSAHYSLSKKKTIKLTSTDSNDDCTNTLLSY